MASNDTTTNYRAWIGIAAALALSTLAVGFMVSKLDFDVVMRAISTARWQWLLIAGVATACITPVRGFRYSVMLRENLFVTSTSAIGVQTFINRVAPMRLGELSLPYLMKKYADVDVAKALVTLVVVRLIELTAVTALLILALALRSERSDLPVSYILVALGLLLAALVWFGKLLRIGIQAARLLTRSSRDSGSGVVHRFLASLDGAAASSESLGGKAHAWVVGATMVQLALQVAVFAAILVSFGVTLGVMSLVLASAITFIGTALPVPSVGTVGPLEASWVAGFAFVGVDLEVAIMTGIATQVLTLVYAAVIAAPCWLHLRRRGAHRAALHQPASARSANE